MDPTEIRDANWQQLRERVSGLRETVFVALGRHGPCTTRELATKSGLDLLTVRPRVTELVDLHFAQCTGQQHGEGVYRALSYDESQAHHRDAQALARGEPVQKQLSLG